MLAASAYAEHFKFMGIPLDGPLPQFEKALLAKGFTPIIPSIKDKPNNKWYKGIFHNNEVSLCVYCTPKSKKVYHVGIGMTLDSDAAAKTEFSSLCSTIEKNYPHYTKEEAIMEDNPDQTDGFLYLIEDNGGIGVYNDKNNIISIHYIDVENNHLQRQEMAEDI